MKSYTDAFIATMQKLLKNKQLSEQQVEEVTRAFEWHCNEVERGAAPFNGDWAMDQIFPNT